MRSSSASIAAVFGLLLLASPGSIAADPYFEELFETSSPSPNLEGQEAFTLAGGSIGPAAPGTNGDRQYIRTVVADYVLRDWVYEVTFSVGGPAHWDIAFIGLGHGDSRPGFGSDEPVNSLHFRVHSPNIADGFYEVWMEGRSPVVQGNVSTYGPHRARITKQGPSVTFELDADFDGSFEADSAFTIEDLAVTAPFLEFTDTHLFFGGVWPETRFHDIRVTHPLAGEVGATRTIQFEENGDTASALVTIAVDADQGPYTLREEFDPGWSVSDISGGGTYTDALLWTGVSASALSYRLSRTGPYFSHQAFIAGSLELQGTPYSIDGDRVIPGSVTPYVSEVLITPSFRMPAGLDGCNVRPADIDAPWIGSCLGPSDATVRPAEGLRLRPTFGSEWSRAAGLDEGLGQAARNRFWSDADDPQGSAAMLARVQADAEGRYDWEGQNAFGANLDNTMCVAYFYVLNPDAEPRRFNIGMGSDDSSGIRVNGEPVARVIGCGGPQCFAGKYQFLLRPGKNLVAFYTFERSGGYNACIRFEDDGGRPTPVRTTLDPTGYADDSPPVAEDCNRNCVVDSDDIASGTSLDADGDGIPDECGPPFADCNRNGVADSEDILSGASKDDDGDGAPDECASAFSVEQGDLYCVTLRLTTEQGWRGGEVGLAYDSSKLEALCAVPGGDFSGSENSILCNLEPDVLCDLPPGLDRGLTLGWVNSGTGEVLPPGSFEVLRICFEPTPAAGTARVCSAVAFTECLGVSGASVSNVITNELNTTVLLGTFSGEVCGEEKPFRRGDANNDDRFDISDPITILTCLFLDGRCPPCRDAGDANDDGRMDISDAAYLLNWRFLGGPSPAAPFLECGFDSTDDSLRGCAFTDC